MGLLKNMNLIRLLLLTGFIGSLFGANAWAQLSPGELSRPHASLEGIENCNRCHGFQKELAPEKCLSCHKFLDQRIKASKGLHADSEHKECGTCHVEHQGKDYDLIYWKGGDSKFNHSLTGYKLEGKHASIDCRACHKEKNVVSREMLLADKIDLGRTYLGLGEECLSCHPDEHRKQFTADCKSCHSMAGWKPAELFNHAKARFVLTGKHIEVQCQKCHPSAPDSLSMGKAYVKFIGLSYEKCLDCHKDAHENRFGQNCESCHNTAGWTTVNQVKFDHSRTRYPLDGAHASVECSKCHKAGKSFKGLGFQACTDCHSDFHQGQFASRATKGACEECHTVAGFSPSKFTLEEHQKSQYLLAGSHLAVPCISCHAKENSADNNEFIRFKFESTRCQVCHKNPHKESVDTYVAKGGCEYCHLVDSWQASGFDHSGTKFALEGKHKDVKCRQCHQKGTGEDAQLQYSGLSLACQDCHEDIHRAQFATVKSVSSQATNETECARCHSPLAWKTIKFDHNRDSAFKLDGAHIKLACVECHKPVIDGTKEYIKYKSLGTTCSACHDANMNMGGGGKS